MSVYAKEKADYFDKSLNSIIDQTCPPDEIVIVKDGKLTEDLDAVINKYAEKNKGLIKTVSLENQAGLGNALNAGLLKCSCDIVARMDSDDICLPYRFEKQINVLQDNKDIDLVGAWTGEFYDEPYNIASVKSLPVCYEDIVKYARSRNPLNHMTVMFRKKSVMEAGNYLPSEGNEDYYLWVRMILNGCRIINLPEILVLARADSNMFRRRGGLKYVKSQIQIEKKLLTLRFINILEFHKNILIRMCISLLPNGIRKIFYMKFLRKKPKMHRG